MKTKILAGVVAVAMMAFGAGCSGTSTGTGDGTGTGAGTGTGTGTGTGDTTTPGKTPPGSTPPMVDANTRYIAETDPAKASAIQMRMWATMTGRLCWYRQNSTANYRFTNVADYVYSGYGIEGNSTSGQVGLTSTGNFGGYDAAEVVIDGQQWWIGIVDANTMVWSKVFNGQFLFETYTAADTGCV